MLYSDTNRRTAPGRPAEWVWPRHGKDAILSKVLESKWSRPHRGNADTDPYRAMFNASYKVATVWGIPIRLHVSLLLMVVFFVYHFARVYGLMWGIIFGVTLELGLSISIVLHELGHSLVAIRKGCRFRRSTAA